MKDFFNFLSEARVSKAAEKAKKLGLTSDGSGGWVDRQGNIQARTVGGELVFSQKRGPTAERETAGRVAATKEDPKAQSQQQAEPEVEKSKDDQTDGDMKNGETITLVFGRFNPPTVGHEKLLNGAKSIAGGSELRIYPSRSTDPKKNPLEPTEKTNMMKQMFPDHAENIVNDEDVKTIFDALKLASDEGYSNVKIVVGSDRVAEFDSLAQKYNGKLYNFDEIETISAGDRDAEGEGVEGMSASKMRKAATENDFDGFRQGIPSSLDDKTARQLMNTVRKRMKVTTESWSLWEIAPKELCNW
jgi:phosphopantetheine adenylyltransferase